MTDPIARPTPPDWRVLVFPGGTEIALEIREALGWCKEVTLFSAHAPVSSHAAFAFARHFELPAVGQAGWLEQLRALVAAQRITHIFPAHDDTLLALAEHAAALAPARVVTSPLETCQITRSKSATRRRLDGVVPTPRQYTTAEAVDRFPVFLKPDRGQGAQRTAVARDAEHLRALLREDPDRLIFEYLPGAEYTVDCFSDRERGLLYASARERRRIRAGIAMDSLPVDDPVWADWAARIAAALPLHGAWFFQARRDVTGAARLLEVAPRVGGTSALSRARGVNLPLLSLHECERRPVRIAPASYRVEIDRALRNRYRIDLRYRAVYVDLDDTLVVHGRVHGDLIKFLHQAIDRGARLVLLTRHAGELPATLRHHRLDRLFDEVVHLRAGEAKADHIREREAVFIDDSFAERQAVHARMGIPVFDPSMIDVLLDERL